MQLMGNIFIGFMAAWVMLGALELFAEKYDWDWYLWVFAFPVLLPAVIIAPICKILYAPWFNVIRPVDRKHFDAVMEASLRGRQFKITTRFYLVIDWAAELIYHKIFFVRIR